MLHRARVLATVAVLVTAPQLADARAAEPERSRPPGPAWTPGAAAAALGRLVARGAEALPRLDRLCAPLSFELRLPLVERTFQLELGSACDAGADPSSLFAWTVPDVDPDVIALRLELRDILAGPDGLLAELLPVASELELLPDLGVLTSSPVPGHESSGFGWRRDPINHRAKFHRGTDFRAKHGTPVYAAGAGRVVFKGRQHGYGNILYIDHGGGVVTRYAHLARFEIDRGELVTGGRLIGRVGATGRATGPHLHFEVRLGDRAVEPSLAMEIAALLRTDPDAARDAIAQLAPALQDQKIDRHDPPRRARSADRRRPAGSRPERAGAPKRVRAVS